MQLEGLAQYTKEQQVNQPPGGRRLPVQVNGLPRWAVLRQQPPENILYCLQIVDCFSIIDTGPKR